MLRRPKFKRTCCVCNVIYKGTVGALVLKLMKHFKNKHRVAYPTKKQRFVRAMRIALKGV